MKILLTLFVLFTFTSSIVSQNTLNSDSESGLDSLAGEVINYNFGYSIPTNVIEHFPFRNQNYMSRFYPGVVSYFQDFYIRGGDSYETGFFIDGVKFNDLFSGENSFFINPNVFEKIDYYNGFMPADLGQSTAGLFNYTLKTGGSKIEFNVEHLTDNISFSNDAFATDKRLGAYFYGYNETNVSLGGPLLFSNVRFFANVNYLYMRDKNPQRYPGVDNLSTYDAISGDSITINLPEGIVPLNSFESFNLVSTLFFDFDKIKIKTSGIYFNDNEFTERHHILQYFNQRAGLVDKSGGIINLNFDHKVNDILSYTLNANYYQKDERITDQYLGNDYWAYGDSVANANEGIIWERSYSYTGRFVLPSNKNVLGFRFQNENFPGINHFKSDQEKISISGNLRVKINNHYVRMGTEYFQHKIRYWQLFDQNQLAGDFYRERNNLSNQGLNDEEIRELVCSHSGVNNFGFDPDGDEADQGLFKAPTPLFYSFYLDDQFYLNEKLFFYLGLRLNFLNFDTKRLIDPASPEKTFNRYTLKIDEMGLVESQEYSRLLPKIHIRYTPIKKISITTSISQNLQTQPFTYLYEGLYSLGYNLSAGFISLGASNVQDIKPILSSEIEIGFNYNSLKSLNTGLNFYFKNIKNQINLDIFEVASGSPYGNYYYWADNRQTDLWGTEIMLEFEKNGFHLLSNLGYQNFKDDLDGHKFNQLRLNVFGDYNFYHLKNISSIFNNLNLSLYFTYNSGHPYYQLMMRNPVPFYSGTTPYVYQIDLKVEKELTIFDNLRINFYLYVINLFDKKNVYDVFTRTGSAEEDGYLSDPNLGAIELENKGEDFGTLYTLVNKYNPLNGQQTFYGPPRQIGLGIKINY